MRSLVRPLSAVVALASTITLGALALADSYGIISVTVVGHDPESVYLLADVLPELEGVPAAITFSPTPEITLEIGQTILHGGPNFIVAPNQQLPGEYGVDARGRDPNEGTEGAN